MQGPESVSLLRAMLALGRAGSTGLLTINAGGRRCRIEVRGGVASSATGSFGALLLGDLLQQRGEFDAAAHRVALDRASPLGPVGPWLVAHGVTTRRALERALREQLRERVLSALAWRELSYGFTPISLGDRPEVPTSALELADARDGESLALDALALAAARRSVDPNELDTWLHAQAGTRHVCTALGRRLLLDSDLFEQPALVGLLMEGATLRALCEAAGASRGDLQLLLGLRRLGALTPAADSGGRYALLLRKHRELRRNVGPAELLELRAGDSSAAARRALRRLTRFVHPDALGPSASPALRRVSSELMRALIDAELQLRPAAARRSRAARE